VVFGKTPDDWSIGRFSKVQLPREFALLIKFLGAVGVDVVDVVVVVVVVVVANRIKVPCCFLVGARVVYRLFIFCQYGVCFSLTHFLHIFVLVSFCR